MLAKLFYILFLILPLVFTGTTSELFEFPKMIFVYIATTAIVSTWIIKSAVKGKLNIPRQTSVVLMLLFLLILLLSTAFSSDTRTSLLGYYSRFNGGFVSILSYFLLLVVFQTLPNQEKINSFKSLALSITIISTIATLEHFGVFITCKLLGFELYQSCWQQDVQLRVFATLGQPNWLATANVATIPFLLYFFLKSKIKGQIVYTLALLINLAALIYTKSRSGLLALIFVAFVFAVYIFKNKISLHKYLTLGVISLISIAIFLNTSSLNLFEAQKINLETGSSQQNLGGTDSGEIRKYVWKAAFNIFLKNPILGSGPETFAFVFPDNKPIEHNLTSEWNFVYNKAHNEFLNYLATTGILGITVYLAMIAFNLKVGIKKVVEKDFIGYVFLASYGAILITNFFGFSTVTSSVIFYLLPALLFNIDSTQKDVKSLAFKISKGVNVFSIVIATLLISLILTILIFRYYKADTHYKDATYFQSAGDLKSAAIQIDKALALVPNEPTYLLSRGVYKNNNADIVKAITISPNNAYYYSINASIYLSSVVQGSVDKTTFDGNATKISLAEESLIKAKEVAQMDPRYPFSLSKLYLNVGHIDKAIENLNHAITLKPNYKDAVFLKGIVQKQTGNDSEAIKTFTTLLENIDPNDERAKEELQLLLEK